MKVTPRKIIIAIMVVFLLIVVGVGGYYYWTRIREIRLAVSGSQLPIRDAFLFAVLTERRKEPRLEDCESFSSPEGKNLCIQIVAFSKGDVALCQKMFKRVDYPHYPMICGLNVEGCLSSIAYSKGDPEICRMIKESYEIRDACFYELGLKTRKPELCEEISSPSVKEDCLKKSLPKEE